MEFIKNIKIFFNNNYELTYSKVIYKVQELNLKGKLLPYYIHIQIIKNSFNIKDGVTLCVYDSRYMDVITSDIPLATKQDRKEFFERIKEIVGDDSIISSDQTCDTKFLEQARIDLSCIEEYVAPVIRDNLADGARQLRVLLGCCLAVLIEDDYMAQYQEEYVKDLICEAHNVLTELSTIGVLNPTSTILTVLENEANIITRSRDFFRHE